MTRLCKANYDLLIIILSLMVTSATRLCYARPGCNDTCGSVTIPFPFGIGVDCALNKWYTINCVNSSTPYLSAAVARNKLEVVGVDLVNRTVTVNTPSISNCQYGRPVLNSSRQINSVALDRTTPFSFSGPRNKLVVEGCGNAVIQYNGTVLSGCSTICGNYNINDSSITAVVTREENNNKCLGITCCETRIPRQRSTNDPYDLKSYTVELITGSFETDDDRRAGGGGSSSCGSAFFVDEDLYVQGRFSNGGLVPVTLDWFLRDLDFLQITCCDFSSLDVLDNGVPLCKQSPELEGNTYLRDGCAGMYN